MKNLIYFSAIISMLACNSSKKATIKNTTTASTQDPITTNTNHYFTVSFISIGTGPDRKAKSKYDQYLIQYEQKNKIKLSYEIIPWGKEGEFNYCFKINELDKKQQEVFIAETKEVLINSTLVRYKENFGLCGF